MLWVASDLGATNAPLELHRKLDGSVPLGGGVVVVTGGVVTGGCVVEGGFVDVGLPVQVTPLRAKLVGAGLLTLFHDPLKPKSTLAPVAMAPL
jgi:hypothetical protein